jgi:hypothetical protein
MIFERFSGLDEAALGPRLGPFCAGLATFISIRENRDDCERSELTELYDLFQSFVSPSRDRSEPRRIAVGDSKKIYTAASGISLLEEGVITFLSASGIQVPCTFSDIIRQLCPEEDYLSLPLTPWFQNSDDLILPAVCDMETIARNTRKVLSGLGECGMTFTRPFMRFVTARAFNRELVRAGGKGRAVQNLISPLLRTAMDAQNTAGSRITVDRQGGRRYYGPWLADLLPGLPLKTREESEKKSVYTCGGLRMEFLVGADGLRLETALASMLAKYAREIGMRLFNAWWKARIPAIKPTAGYPQDASRFISDVAEAGMMPADPDLLIRRL